MSSMFANLSLLALPLITAGGVFFDDINRKPKKRQKPVEKDIENKVREVLNTPLSQSSGFNKKVLIYRDPKRKFGSNAKGVKKESWLTPFSPIISMSDTSIAALMRQEPSKSKKSQVRETHSTRVPTKRADAPREHSRSFLKGGLTSLLRFLSCYSDDHLRTLRKNSAILPFEKVTLNKKDQQQLAENTVKFELKHELGHIARNDFITLLLTLPGAGLVAAGTACWTGLAKSNLKAAHALTLVATLTSWVATIYMVKCQADQFACKHTTKEEKKAAWIYFEEKRRRNIENKLNCLEKLNQPKKYSLSHLFLSWMGSWICSDTGSVALDLHPSEITRQSMIEKSLGEKGVNEVKADRRLGEKLAVMRHYFSRKS